MNRMLILSFLVLLSLIALACAPGKTQPDLSASGGKSVNMGAAAESRAPARPDWEIKWEQTLARARKEGSVVVYTSAPGETNRMVSQAFQDKYGIKAEFIAGRGGELTSKLLTERKSGLYLVDAYVSGLGTSLFYGLKPADAVEPLEKYFINPDISRPEIWFEGLRWFDDERTALAFHAYVSNSASINSTIVKAGEIKSFKDLLNPRWKGKIVMNDPIPTGTGQRFIGFLHDIMGMDYLRELAKQSPVMVRDQRLQVEWLARGRYPIATSTKNEIMWEFTQAGASIEDIGMEEGGQITAGGGVVTVLRNAPHPNAVAVFINWLLSYDGQLVYSKATGKQSRRLDVPTAHLDPTTIRKPGVKYFDQTRRDFVLREPEFVKIAQEVFGPLLK